MADLLAIADAIAARYAAIPGIRLATGRPPNAVPVTPAVVVWPMSGDVTFSGGRMLGVHDYRVALYYATATGDMPRYLAGLSELLGPCLTALAGQAKLGLAPTVTKALVTDWEAAVLTYAGAEYAGAQLTARVWTEEQVELTP